MKPITTTVALLLVAGFSACCTKKNCIYPTKLVIAFVGFDTAQVDTIIITGYELNGSFSKKTTREYIDTAVYYPESGRAFDREIEALYHNLDIEHEWDVYVPGLDRHYRFSNYKIGTRNCNNCPFQNEPIFEGFKVNDRYIEGYQYTIDK